MPTVCLRFKVRPRPDMTEILETVRYMEQKAVNWLIGNKKTSLKAVHDALYHQFRQQFQGLHSQWVISALKTATGIVHQFNRRKRKGKTKRPKLRKPFVSLNPHLFKVAWNGTWLRVTILKSAHDLEPIVFEFRPHHRYRLMLERWRNGEATMGQITLTPDTISIPIKFPPVPTYQPVTVIGIDSNENSLDCFNPQTGELITIDISEVARINRDYDRRVRKATKGKNNPKAKKKIQQKYGFLRKERTKQIWFLTALALIQMAGRAQAALALENLNGMKLNLRRVSKRMRQRLLNHWSIMTFHRILMAKAAEYGVPVVLINPQGTSKTCPICGECLRGQDKKCPTCGLSRHYVAAINIARRGLEKFPDLLRLGQGGDGDSQSLILWQHGKRSAVRCHDEKGG